MKQTARVQARRKGRSVILGLLLGGAALGGWFVGRAADASREGPLLEASGDDKAPSQAGTRPAPRLDAAQLIALRDEVEANGAAAAGAGEVHADPHYDPNDQEEGFEVPPGAAAPELPPKEHRDQVVEELRASGADQRFLGAAADKVEAAWVEKLQRLKVGGEVGKFSCFAKGCFVTIEHASITEAENATQVITRTAEFNGWQSGKMRSGLIEKSNGRIELTWVLYPPEEGASALVETLPDDSFDDLPALIASASSVEPSPEPEN